MSAPAARIFFGTAQCLGGYGVARSAGEGARIWDRLAAVRAACAAGVGGFDTAGAYGPAERFLGLAAGRRAGRDAIEGATTLGRIVTKISAAEAARDPDGPTQGVLRQIAAARGRLAPAAIDAVLIHDPAAFFAGAAQPIVEGLEAAKAAGLCRTAGLSLYEAAEVEALLQLWRPDLVQAPANLADRRLFRSGAIDRLAEAGVEIHLRSLYLQGAFFLAPDALPAHLAPLRPLNAALTELDFEARIAACLSPFLADARIGGLVIGARSLEETRQTLRAAGRALDAPPALGDFSIEDERVLNPALWPRPAAG